MYYLNISHENMMICKEAFFIISFFNLDNTNYSFSDVILQKKKKMKSGKGVRN